MDPVFVDEESSGEAVAKAADQDEVGNVDPITPPAPVQNPPPLPEMKQEMQPSPPPDDEVAQPVAEVYGTSPTEAIDDDDEGGYESDFSIPDEELEALLEKDVKTVDKDSLANAKVPHTERVKVSLRFF